MAGPDKPSGLSCLRSFQSLTGCAKDFYQNPPEMDGSKNGINHAVGALAEKIGLTEIDPVKSAQSGIVGQAVRRHEQRMTNGG